MNGITKEELEREKNFWNSRFESQSHKIAEASKRASACAEKCLLLDRESEEGKKAKTEWDFETANLAKLQMEADIMHWGPGLICLLSMGTDPDNITEFVETALEKNIVFCMMKILADNDEDFKVGGVLNNG